jgi:thiamine monophosphate synthase
VCLQVVGDIGQDSVRGFSDAGATVILVARSILEREDLPRAYRRLVQALHDNCPRG